MRCDNAGCAIVRTPGARGPARTGEAGRHDATAPGKARARGLARVGVKGNGGDAVVGDTCGSGGRMAGAHTGAETPGALFGSGRCLQSRISHDDFLRWIRQSGFSG